MLNRDATCVCDRYSEEMPYVSPAKTQQKLRSYPSPVASIPGWSLGPTLPPLPTPHPASCWLFAQHLPIPILYLADRLIPAFDPFAQPHFSYAATRAMNPFEAYSIDSFETPFRMYYRRQPLTLSRLNRLRTDQAGNIQSPNHSAQQTGSDLTFLLKNSTRWAMLAHTISHTFRTIVGCSACLHVSPP